MKDQTSQKGLARRRFLSLLGKSALGLWLLQLVPTSLGAIKTPGRRKQKSSNLYAARVKAHPLAVERTKRG